MSTLLQTTGLSRRFGGIQAVDQVDVTVGEGEIVGLIGPNGAGKTTFVNLVTGFLAPTGGAVRYEDSDITGLRADRLARKGIGRTFQNLRLFPHRTLLENVRIGAYLRGRSGIMSGLFRLPASRKDEDLLTDAAWDALDVVGLADRAHEEAAFLSTGEQRLAEVARALAGGPRLLFLDEPAAGLNETETASLTAALRTFPAKGITLLVIEHHLALIMAICDKVAVLNEGRLLAAGTPQEVRNNREVVTAYVGED
jgi:branched-chain amino acid transport system ATP-binding protein